MQPKKNPQVDLEKKRPMYLQIGLALSLGLVLFAFEWKTYERSDHSLGELQVDEIEEDIIPITEQKTTPPPPPPPPPMQLEVVEDDADVEEADFKSTEFKENMVIPTAPPPAEETNENEIFLIVEEQPKFPGGDAALVRFVQENLKYPYLARENSITGTVYVTFVINKNGEVEDPQVLRGIGYGCDEEAIRVIKSMPKWNPGKQRGKPVKVRYQMPIKFSLR